MLDDVKVLCEIPINDSSKDKLLSIYIRKAITAIKYYLNNDKFTDEYIKDNFQDAIVELVTTSYENKDNKNVKSYTEGKQSITYQDNTNFTITEDVANLLPVPYGRFF